MCKKEGHIFHNTQVMPCLLVNNVDCIEIWEKYLPKMSQDARKCTLE